MTHRWRPLIGVALVLGVSIYVIASYVTGVQKAVAGVSPQMPLITMEAAFRKALVGVPRGERLGFYTGTPIRIDEFADQNSAIYYIAEYAASPRVLTRDTQPRLVLTFLWTEAALAEYVTKNRMRVLSHPDTGVALLEQPAP